MNPDVPSSDKRRMLKHSPQKAHTKKDRAPPVPTHTIKQGFTPAHSLTLTKPGSAKQVRVGNERGRKREGQGREAREVWKVR